MKRFLSLLLIFVLILFSRARGEEVSVEAEAVPEEEEVHATGAVTTIDTREAVGRVSDIGEALEESAGVTVKRYGGLGSYSTVMIRGASPNQVRVYLDGVPLSGGASGVFNLSDIPIDILERIEVYRGVAPLGFSGAPIGGVINLVTREPKEGWAAGGAASYGSFATYKGTLFGDVATDEYNALAFYSHLQSEGNFRYIDDNATSFNKADDRWVERQNNDFSQDAFLVKGGWKPADRWEFLAANLFFRKDAGLPGLGAFRIEDARIATLRNTFYAGARYRGSVTKVRSVAYYTHVREEFLDPEGEIGLGMQENRYYTRTFGAKILTKTLIGDRAMIALFAEGTNENYKERDLINDSSWPEATRSTLTGAAQAEVYLWDEKVILVPTIRAENYVSDFPGRSSATYGLPAEESSAVDTYYSPHFGIKIKPAKIFSITGNIGQYYRVPTFMELFGDRGSVIGNPELEVESGLHADAGAKLAIKKRGKIDRLKVAYSFFYLDIDDIIIMVQNSQRTAFAENISRAEIFGHEFALQAVLWNFFKARAAYTFQNARDRSGISYLDDNPLPGRPRNELHTRAALFKKKKGEIFHKFDYLDGNFLDRAGYLQVPARRIHGAGITVKPVKGLSVTLEVKNIGNEQVSDLLGYPLPGRSYFGTVKYVYSKRKEEEEGEK